MEISSLCPREGSVCLTVDCAELIALMVAANHDFALR
jgi:hypothetical protein